MHEGSFSPRIIDSALDAVVIVDDRGVILYANRATEQLLGWRVDALFGVPFLNLVPERFRSSYSALFYRFMKSNPPQASYAPRRMMALRADGSELPVDIGTFIVVPDVGPKLLITVLWDVSDRIDIDRYQRVSDELVAFLAGAAGSSTDIIPQLLSIVATNMDFELATSWRWDADAEVLRCEHVWRECDDEYEAMMSASAGMSVRAGEGLAGFVVHANEPVWQTDLSEASQFHRHDAIVADGLRTAFVFPLRARERLVGAIELFTKSDRHPDAPLNAAVADIGAKLGEFIERLELEAEKAELMERLEQSLRHQEFLLRANRALAGAHNFQDSVERLATVALPTLGDICLIDVVSPAGRLERLAAVHADPTHQAETNELSKYSPDPRGSHPAARAVRTGESQWSTDMDDQFMRSTTQGDRHFKLTQSLGFESYVSVPLLMEVEAIGALTVITAGSGRQFGREELLLAETLASQVTAVIEKARVFDEQSSISHLLQNSLLPDRLDEVPGVSVAARYVAAGKGAEVGGDFYDVVKLDGDRLALVIGDVEGHNITAATVMGELRSALRAYLLMTDDPAEVLRLANRYALKQTNERLTTTCLAVMDPERRTIDIATAGHPPPFAAFEGNPALPLSIRPGQPLGVWDGEYVLEHFELPAVGTLVFFTDGLIDEGRTDAPGRIHTLTELLEGHHTDDPESLADTILSALARPGPVHDDLALLVVQWAFPR